MGDSMYTYVRNLNKREIEQIAEECNLGEIDTQILFLLSRGYSLQEISNSMLISTATVTRKIKRIVNRIDMIKI